MRVSLIGATGNAGSRILAELAQRGHQVTAVVRNPERVPGLDGVIAKECDANRVDDLAPVLRGHDVVVRSVHFLDGQADKLIDAVPGARASLRRRWRRGQPRQWRGRQADRCGRRARAIQGGIASGLRVPRRAGLTSDLDWTFLSPSAQFVAGERTGVFRLGTDTALRDASGRSWISYEDYAVALVDEIEQPRHSQRRFTVGY